MSMVQFAEQVFVNGRHGEGRGGEGRCPASLAREKLHRYGAATLSNCEARGLAKLSGHRCLCARAGTSASVCSGEERECGCPHPGTVAARGMARQGLCRCLCACACDLNIYGTGSGAVSGGEAEVLLADMCLQCKHCTVSVCGEVDSCRGANPARQRRMRPCNVPAPA